jgi:hypothetical protein
MGKGWGLSISEESETTIGAVVNSPESKLFAVLKYL